MKSTFGRGNILLGSLGKHVHFATTYFANITILGNDEVS